METPEKQLKNVKSPEIKDSELERIKKKGKKLDEEIERLKDEKLSDTEIAIILAKKDSEELIEQEGSIEGEEDRAKARKQKEREENKK